MNNSWISSAGETLIASSLRDNMLGCTAEDGSFQVVEISEVTYRIAEKTVQKIFDSFEWMTVVDQLREAQKMGRLGGDISQILSELDQST